MELPDRPHEGKTYQTINTLLVRVAELERLLRRALPTTNGTLFDEIHKALSPKP